MKDNIKTRTPFKNVNILLPALFALAICALALLASCENILEAVPRKNTGGGTSRTLPRKAQRTLTR